MGVERVLKVVVVLYVAYLTSQVSSRMPRLRPDRTKPPRDYRPSKWLTNSAMDVWYGNKSVVEILSREFKDIVDKLAMRPVRASLLNSQSEMEKEIKKIKNLRKKLDNTTSQTA